jgi:hypothetical protein
MLSLRPKSAAVLADRACRPIDTCGYRSAVATPMRAVDAASVRSAWRMSGRRRSSCAPSPTGSTPATRGGVVQSATSRGKSCGSAPVSVARRYSAACRLACSGGSAALSDCSCARARPASMAPARPAFCRRSVTLTASFCKPTDFCAISRRRPVAQASAYARAVPAATFTRTRSSAASAASVLAAEASMARRNWPNRSTW